MKTRFTQWVARAAMALLFVSGLTMSTSVMAQCGYSYQNLPLTLTVNMSGSTAVIDQSSLSPILGATVGCNLYYEYPAGTLNTTDTLDCTMLGSQLIIVRADDDGIIDANSSDTIHVIVNLIDNSPPVPTCPGDQTVNTADDGGFDCTVTGIPGINVIVTDNCTYTVSYTITNNNTGPLVLTSASDDNAGDEVFPVGVNTVVYTVTDQGGNTASCQFTVTVIDNEDPQWTPSPISGLGSQVAGPSYDAVNHIQTLVLDCNNASYADDLDSLSNNWLPTALDNCSDTALVTMDSMSIAPIACATVLGIANVYSSKTIYYSAVDDFGNAIDTSYILVIYTSDNDGPDYADPGANVPSASVIELVPNVFIGDAVTLNGTDPNACGIDFTAAPYDTILPATAVDCQAITYTGWTITYTGAPPTPAFVPAGIGNDPSQFLPSGSYSITYNSTDPCGNASSYTFSLNILDTIAPVISGCPSNITGVPNEAGNCYATVAWVRPTALDNCDSITYVSNYADPDSSIYPLISGVTNDYGVFPVGTSTVHYVFSDQYGNTTTCYFTVTVDDVEAPTITCSGNQNFNSICDSARVPDYTGLANIFDNCQANGFIVTQTPPAGTLVSSVTTLAAGSTFNVALVVTDSAGNPNPDPVGGSNECLFTVTLFDNDAPIPVLAMLPDINPGNTTAASCGSYILFAPIALDCNGDTIYGQASFGGATYNPGPPPSYTLTPNTYVINWTYDDGNGNVATQLQTVQVINDAVAPVLNCPADATINTNPGVCTNTGAAGFTMIDLSPHVGGLMNYPGPLLDNQAIDNCDIVNFYYSVSGATTIAKTLGDNVGSSSLNKGVNTVTYYGQDAQALEGTCSFTITVQDVELPTFTCAPNALLETGTSGNDAVQGDCRYTVGALDTSLDPTNINDNCAMTTVTHSLLLKLPFNAGYTAGPSGSSLAGTQFTLTNVFLNSAVYFIQWTVTDMSGNTSTCIQTLVVRDDTDPVITCKPNATRTTSQDGILGDCLYRVQGTEFNPTATDECDNNVFLFHNYGPAPSSTTLAGADFPVGVTAVTWTALDNAGNTSTCVIVITVNDDEVPVFTYCPSNITLANVSGDCENFVVWERPTLTGFSGGPDVTDNCTSAANLSMTETISNAAVQAAINNNYPFDPHSGTYIFPASSFPVGTTTITYVATDAMGNTASCQFTVTINDTEAPTVSNPGPQTLPSICANATVPNYMALVNVFDNCNNEVTVTQWPAPGTALSAIPGLIPPVTNNIGNPPADGQTFTVTITATNTNPLGLSGSTSFVVTLDDTQNPVPNVPGASLPPVTTFCGPLTLQAPSANDCGLTIYGIPNTGMYNVGSNPPTYTFGLGNWNVIWTYIDPQNNTSSQSQIVSVNADVVPPSMICPSDITVFTPSNSCNISGITAMNMTQVFSAPVLPGTYYDLCGVTSITYSLSGATTVGIKPGTNNASISGEVLNLGVTYVTYYVTDAAGNQSTCSSSITLKDNVAPVLSGIPGNLTADCSNVPAPPVIGVGGVTASDNCTSSPTIIFGESSTKGANPALCSFYSYVITRTWTAIDASGNTSSAVRTVTVSDGSAPVLNGNFPMTITGNNDVDLCTKNVSIVITPSMVTDNCAAFGNLTITNNSPVGPHNASASGNYPVGTTTFTYTVTDPCGNSTTKVVTVTITDNQAPTPACVVSVAVPIGASGSVTLNPASFNAASYDNCAGPLTFSLNPNTINCSNVGQTVNVILTVTDQYGNSATCLTFVEVQDNVTPTITLCPADITVGCNSTLDPNLNPLLGVPSVTDNCTTIVTHADVATAPGPGICSAFNRIWTVKDAFNNSSSCIQKISIQDITPPTFSGNAPADVTIACGTSLPTAPTVTASDFCDPSVPVTFTETSTKTNNSTCTDFTYVVTRTWTATDDCGNTAHHTQHITVIDNVAPVFANMPAPIVLYTGQFNSLLCTVPVNLVLTGSNLSDCEGFGNLTVTNNSPVGPHTASASGNYPVGTYTVVFTATDKCGNSSTASVSITIIDDSKPVAKCHDIINLALNSSGVGTITTADVNDNSFDNCTLSSLSLNITSFDCSDLGQNAVILTVTDQAGNTNVCNSIINVEDNIVPVITFCPADITVNCTNSLDPSVNTSLGTATASDNCTATVTYTDASTTPPAGFCSALLRTWKATDSDGNTAVCTQKLTVQDNTPPSFTGSIPSDVTITCGTTVPAPPTLTATDFCDPVVPVTFTQSSTQTSNNSCSDFSYVVTRTWTATDDCGNTATLSRKITVVDNAAPVFVNVPSTINLNTESFNSLLCSAPVSLNLNATNITDCEGFSNLTITNNAPFGNGSTNISGTYPVGTYAVTFTATDKCGNVGTALVTITVTDNSKPIAKCHDIVNVALNGAGLATVTPANVNDGSIDNCSIANLSLNISNFSCANIGNNPVILTVTDQAGNTNVCTSVISIQDNLAPSITFCPADVTVGCAASLDPLLNGSLGIATATDNCSSQVTVTYTDASTSPSPGFCSAILRTWRATDAGNNSATCTQKINVQDATAPTFNGPAPTNLVLSCGSQVPAAAVYTASDFCDPSVTVTFNETSTKTSNNTCTDFSYVVNRSWLAIDDCGNTASRSQQITVQDNVAPVFSNMPGPIVLHTSDFNSLLCSAPVSLVLTSANVSDCQGFNNLTITNNSPFGVGGANASGQYPVGTYQVKFTATDKCGNSSMATVTVTVIDNTIPVAICHDVINLTINNNGVGNITPADVDNGSHDNCGNVTLSLNITQFDCTDIGNNTVILTVTDNAGNTNTCTSIVKVNSPNGSLTLTFSTTNESAPGAHDGSATAIVTGGSGSYGYMWNDPNNSTTQTINGLSAGTYTVTVTDLITGCKAIDQVTVNVNPGSGSVMISGNIMTPTGQNVALVQVDLTGSTIATQTTNNSGNYSFTVPTSSTVTVTPIKNIYPTNGVTALDMAIIQQHVTNPNTPTLTNPYMLIAGDINNDGLINGADLAIGQAVILGNLLSFPNNTSWVFVPKSYIFPNPLNPFTPAYPHKLTYTNLQSNQINQNYWGIKVGDVEYSANPAQVNGGNSEVRDYTDETKFVTYDKQLSKGAVYNLNFTSENFKDILAYQFTMEADPEYLEIIDATPGILPGMNSDYFGMKKANEGSITSVWYNNAGFNLYPKENAFGITVKVKKSGKKLSDVLKLSDKQIISTGYNSNYKAVELGLKFVNDFVTNETPTFELYQNQPNPFKQTTTITFALPFAQRASIQVMDLDGKVIRSVEKNYEKGINREELQMDNVTPGVFYYKVSTSSNSAVKKMVIIE